MNTLQDTDPMPWGKHKNTPMQDVPVSYFHYLWTNGMKNETHPVSQYVRRNLSALMVENKDLIWD